MENTVDKVIITVVGKDTVGIIAKVCTYLSENHINVLDISQTIVSGFFNMMMIVDMSQSSRSFGDCQKDLDAVGDNRNICLSGSYICHISSIGSFSVDSQGTSGRCFKCQGHFCSIFSNP